MSFFTMVFSVWTIAHIYLFWRVSTIGAIAKRISRKWIALFGVICWISFPAAQMLEHSDSLYVFRPIIVFGANWLGVMLLTSFSMFAADIVTGFGLFFKKTAPYVKEAALLVGVAFSVIALIQGYRCPAVVEYEVGIKNLPKEADGLIMVAIADTHLGTQLGEKWLADLVKQIEGLDPDILVMVGDIFEGDGPIERYAGLKSELSKFSAPLGVWAVTGNHEVYAELEKSVPFLESAGIRMLRNEKVEILPGLVLAGIDDQGTRRRRNKKNVPVEKIIKQNESESPLIFLSHRPSRAAEAAKAGASLMLSGHTHNGQIWPFTYLVKQRHPLLGGRYTVYGMPVIVIRGTGTWGPRMRLWRRSEIVKITFYRS